MDLILILAITILLTVAPVMIAAKVFKAEHSSFMRCLFAVICSAVAEYFIRDMMDNQGLASVVSLLVTAVLFAMILGAKFGQSLLIALLAIGMYFGIAYLLVSFGLAVSGPETTVWV